MSVWWAVLLAGLPLEAQVKLPADAGAVSTASLPFVWELPEKTVHEVPIDGTTLVAGIPVRLRYLLVKGSAEDIGRHFLASFIRQGLYVAPRQDVTRLLTGVDPGSVVTYSVVLQPNTEGHTTVILGEAKPIDRKKGASPALPVPPSVQGAIPVQHEGTTVLSFRASESVETVTAFYARELTQQGYRPVSAKTWARPGEQLDVTISAEGATSRVLLEQRRGSVVPDAK